MTVSREASIYERRGFLFFIGSSQTEAGLWIEEGLCTVMSMDSSPLDIGTAARDALDRSGRRIPHPTEWESNDENNAVLEMAGIKRWSTFQRIARLVGVSLYDGKLVVTPTANEGADGFGHLNDDALQLSPGVAPEQLGAAIGQALSRCR